MFSRRHWWRWVLLVPILLIVGLQVSLLILRAQRPDRTPIVAQPLFQGITYDRQVLDAPRPVLLHIITIDLTQPDIRFFATPGAETRDGDLFAQTTPEFLDKHGLQLAINGSFYFPFHSNHPLDFYPRSGDPVNVIGLAISDGVVYSNDYSDLPVLCIQGRDVTIQPAGCPDGTEQAVAGQPRLLEGNEVRIPSGRSALNARTIVALDAARTTMWIVVADGKQPDYSEGVRLTEMVDLVRELGAVDAINFDGGGSSSLVQASPQGPMTLNAPIHTRVPTRHRPVANHLGIYAAPLP